MLLMELEWEVVCEGDEVWEEGFGDLFEVLKGVVKEMDVVDAGG